VSKKNNLKSRAVIHSDITKEDLKQVIIDAKKAVEEDETSCKREANARWKAALGLRDDLSGYKKLLNDFSSVSKLLAFPKKYRNKNAAFGTRLLMTAFLEFVFLLAEMFCWFFAVYVFFAFHFKLY